MSAEVLVVGGGPAGLAAAIAAAQIGFSVEIAEPCIGPGPASISRPESLRGVLPPAFSPIDKCCGEGLLPPALQALSALGIGLFELSRHSAPIRGIQFRYGQRLAHADFPKGSAGIGMRRLHLHALLSRRAQALGVTFTAAPARVRLDPVHGSPIAEVGGQSRKPQWILGADGTQSAARMTMGLDRGRLHSRRFALRQHFLLHAYAELRHVEVHWARGAQAYLTPIGEGAAGVAILSNHRFASMREALAAFPDLQARLGAPLPTSSPRGAVSCHRTLRSVICQNFALIGDASGGVDAITGEGLAIAFQQALRVAEAMRFGDLSHYQAAHAALLRRPRLMSRALLAMGSHPALTAAAMSGLCAIPGLFQGLLRLHNQPLAATASPVSTNWRGPRISPESAS